MMHCLTEVRQLSLFLHCRLVRWSRALSIPYLCFKMRKKNAFLSWKLCSMSWLKECWFPNFYDLFIYSCLWLAILVSSFFWTMPARAQGCRLFLGSETTNQSNFVKVQAFLWAVTRPWINLNWTHLRMSCISWWVSYSWAFHTNLLLSSMYSFLEYLT